MSTNRLNVRGHGDSSTGFGQMGAKLIGGLEAEGIPCLFDPYFTTEDRRPLDPILRSRLGTAPAGQPCLVTGGLTRKAPPGSVVIAMWEATRLRPGGVQNLNTFACVVVPCEANARWFRSSGVTVPIRVVPLGIDPGIYHPTTESRILPPRRQEEEETPERERENREKRNQRVQILSLPLSLSGVLSPDLGVLAVKSPRPPFRVGCAGRVGEWVGNRKGLDLVAACFLDAFPDAEGEGEDARLEIKVYPDCKIAELGHPRITLVKEALSDEGLADWYRSLDLFCSASRGEGWGLQPHQAMACGTPVAAPIWGGHSAYMTPESSYPLAFEEQLAGRPYGRGPDVPPRRSGVFKLKGNKMVQVRGTADPSAEACWCVVDPASLVAAMREARADPAARLAKGNVAAIRAAEFTWSRSARELAEVLREFQLCR
jgi:glycosyltransferase involved in cell wall biosynthesis